MFCLLGLWIMYLHRKKCDVSKHTETCKYFCVFQVCIHIKYFINSYWEYLMFFYFLKILDQSEVYMIITIQSFLSFIKPLIQKCLSSLGPYNIFQSWKIYVPNMTLKFCVMHHKFYYYANSNFSLLFCRI